MGWGETRSGAATPESTGGVSDVSKANQRKGGGVARKEQRRQQKWRRWMASTMAPVTRKSYAGWERSDGPPRQGGRPARAGRASRGGRSRAWHSLGQRSSCRRLHASGRFVLQRGNASQQVIARRSEDLLRGCAGSSETSARAVSPIDSFGRSPSGSSIQDFTQRRDGKRRTWRARWGFSRGVSPGLPTRRLGRAASPHRRQAVVGRCLRRRRRLAVGGTPSAARTGEPWPPGGASPQVAAATTPSSAVPTCPDHRRRQLVNVSPPATAPCSNATSSGATAGR